jgi:hypothetical protein
MFREAYWLLTTGYWIRIMRYGQSISVWVTEVGGELCLVLDGYFLLAEALSKGASLTWLYREREDEQARSFALPGLRHALARAPLEHEDGAAYREPDRVRLASKLHQREERAIEVGGAVEVVDLNGEVMDLQGSSAIY